MCGTLCKNSWCELRTEICQGISSADSRLCGNPLVFRNVSCAQYSNECVEYYGMRCTGTNQECILPWYTKWDGYYNPADMQICVDKSDQIFTIGLTCREDLQKHFDFHDEHFCTSDYPRYPYIQDKPICKNKTEHISMYPEATTDDPHHCQSSCSSPGLDCVACTNTT